MEDYTHVSKEELQSLVNRCKTLLLDNLISDETKQDLYTTLRAALSSDADFRAVFEKADAAEQERRKTVHDVLSADPVFMDMLEDLKPERMQLYEDVADAMGLPANDEQSIEIAKQAYKKNGLDVFTPTDSGHAYINNGNVTKMLLRREKGDVWVGDNPQTGEPLICTVYNGYLAPLEADITESIIKFKRDGQVTKSGKPWCTLSQLYRAQRHGAGTTRPTRAQLDALLQQLKEMAKEERKIDWGLSDRRKLGELFPEYEEIDQETERVRLRIVSFDEFYGKLQGQKDWVIVFDNTPFLGKLEEWLRMGEEVPQEVKAIKYTQYYIEYQTGGDVVTKWFTSNEERQKFCKRNGIKGADITNYYEHEKPFTLTDQRIAIRHTLLSFVFSYMRARLAGKPHSNKLPYATIWERCDVDVKTSLQLIRAKDTVRIILDHLVNTIPELSRWGEYKNNGSRKADGVQISVAAAIEGGS